MAKKDLILTCAIARSTSILGDKWSLLILRDMLFHHKTRFKEFIDSKEKIATNILTNRIKSLIDAGLIKLLDPKSTKKNRQYVATEKGISTLPIIIELYLFSIKENNESVLSDKQLNIKKEILDNRDYFESSKRIKYLAFKESLLNKVRDTISC